MDESILFERPVLYGISAIADMRSSLEALSPTAFMRIFPGYLSLLV